MEVAKSKDEEMEECIAILFLDGSRMDVLDGLCYGYWNGIVSIIKLGLFQIWRWQKGVGVVQYWGLDSGE